MKVYFNPTDKACKSLIGAFSQESIVEFNVINQSVEERGCAEECTIYFFQDGEEAQSYPLDVTTQGWTITLRFNECGLYFYYFKIGNSFLCCGKLQNGILSDQLVKAWQVTVYDKEYSTPEWFKGGTMYQIFPDRFHKSGQTTLPEWKIQRNWGETPYYKPNAQGEVLNNDFFGGNLNGIREKLPYLKKLGVTVLYLNPIFEAYSNHRYDTGDYLKIDSALGTVEDFDLLIQEAETYGIKIILDGVFNHTGSDSRYFNRNGRYSELGAYQSKQSPYYDWYTFQDFPNSYDSWWGIKTLPAVNEQSTSYQNFIFGENGVLKHWLRHGIGGFRLDVADELPDFFLKNLRFAVKEENGNALILGEVWEDASNKIAYGKRREYLQGNELDSVMNYPLKDAIIHCVLTKDTSLLRETIQTLIDNYPKIVLDSLMNILGTHDTVRILTVLSEKYCDNQDKMAVTFLTDGEKMQAIEKLKMAALLQFFLPGVPCIYYGDEIAMEGYRDPFCRRCFDWENGNQELMAFYQKLGSIRADLRDVFSEGVYREIYSEKSFLMFARTAKEKTVYVYLNLSYNQYSVDLNGIYTERISGNKAYHRLNIAPNSFGILTKE